MNGGKNWLLAGCVSGFLAVGLGAFGAHGVEQAIPKWYDRSDLAAEDLEKSENLDAAQGAQFVDRLLDDLYRKKLKTWSTGVRYHFYHTFAILTVGLASILSPGRLRWFDAAGTLFVLGILGFSGSIYLLVVTKVGIFGMIAALGGTLQLAGWVFLAVAIWNSGFELRHPVPSGDPAPGQSER